jgi:DNA-binding NtrC family response regulator
LADIIQANSRRRDRPFVKVNAGGLPDELLEAELFGAEAGAYTGATRQRLGRFESANGGTLFLDEIGNLTLNGQMKLLRVLQTGEFERLGSSVTKRVDVRIVSATNTDLPRAIASGAFREDLYFRLNVIELYVPPLGERLDDLGPLVEHFLEEYTTAGATPPTLTEASRAALQSYEWPGNIRELQNRIQRATLVCKDRIIRPEDLGLGTAPSSPSTSGASGRLSGPQAVQSGSAAISSGAPAGTEPEREAIEEALVKMKGVVSKAAAELGMSRQALYRRMERLGIIMERRPKG